MNFANAGHKMMRYTFFVPKDSAFFNLWPQDTADPFIIDAEFRRQVLLGHFVPQRLYGHQLTDGLVITMANNSTVKVTRVASKLTSLDLFFFFFFF